MSMLAACDLETRYENHTVFRDLNIEIKKGSITTIIGPNGCGKSTLLKTMGRIMKQKHGIVYLQEQNLNTLSTRTIAKLLSLLPQNPAAPNELLVEELISYGRYPHRKNLSKQTPEDEDVINWAMDITNTSSFSKRALGTLSGGQRQKVWLAMALAQDTEILLLDEPTTSLDMAHQLEVLKIVERLNREHQCTIAMVLHDINHAARFSDEIIAMKKGEIAAAGTPKDIITPDILQKVFRINARVMVDPFNDAPVCYGYENE